MSSLECPGVHGLGLTECKEAPTWMHLRECTGQCSLPLWGNSSPAPSDNWDWSSWIAEGLLVCLMVTAYEDPKRPQSALSFQHNGTFIVFSVSCIPWAQDCRDREQKFINWVTGYNSKEEPSHLYPLVPALMLSSRYAGDSDIHILFICLKHTLHNVGGHPNFSEFGVAAAGSAAELSAGHHSIKSSASG